MQVESNNLSPMTMIRALASRIVQIQSTRYTQHSESIQAVETYRENARLFWIAERLIEKLIDPILSGDNGYQLLSSVHRDLRHELPDLTIEEVRVIAKFLNNDVAFYYLNQQQKMSSTRSMTKLIDYQSRSDRLKLTKHGRIINRITELQKDWLYEDKNVEKILRAISMGDFYRVESLCIEVINTIGLVSSEITEIRENASYQDMANSYLLQREQFSETIRLCLDAIHKCLDSMDSRETKHKLKSFLENGAQNYMDRKYFKDMIIEVTSACESLSRNFTLLIRMMQEDHSPRLGILNFLDVLEKFVASNLSTEGMASVINDSFGWMHEVNHFSCLDLEEKLDLTKPEPVVHTVKFKPSNDHAILNWLHENKTILINELRDGPKSFTELLVMTHRLGLLLDKNNVADLFSVVLEPINLDEGIDIKFTYSESLDTFEMDEYYLSVSHITLSLMEASYDPD